MNFRSCKLATLALGALTALTSLVPAQQPPNLPPGAEALAVPAGNAVSLRAFAVGVQIYRWNETTNQWAFVQPSALLFAGTGFPRPIGYHDVGPTWTSWSGSRVVGAFAAGFTVDPTAIPWLKLSAVSSNGPGVFNGTTFIQRVNTTGGRAPSRTGALNEVVEIPYTAEYYFYRAL